MLNSETPFVGKIKRRFDLGFILELPFGAEGQLRVPFMSKDSLRIYDEPDKNACVDTELTVYVIAESDRDCLLTEYSPNERNRRKSFVLDTKAGDRLSVVVKNKTSWGCICKDADNLLTGTILASDMIEKYEIQDPELTLSDAAWETLKPGDTLIVEIVGEVKRNPNWISCTLKYIRHAE